MKTKLPIHYAWVICAMCTLLQFATCGLTATAFSVHMPYLISLAGMSNTQCSLLVTIRMLATLVAISGCQVLYRTLGIRRSAAVAAWLAAAAFVVFGFAASHAAYYIGALLCGLAFGLGGSVIVSVLIERWFASHKALALGICSAGTGLSAIVVPPIVTWIIQGADQKCAFFTEAVACLLLGALALALLRGDPEEMRLQPLRQEGSSRARRAAVPDAPARPIAPAIMACMCLAAALNGAIGNVSYSHIAVLYSGAGYSQTQVAMLLSIIGCSLMIGKCCYGGVTDRIGVIRSGIIFFSLMTVGQALCCFVNTGSLPIAVAAMIVNGFGYSLTAVGIPVFASAMSPKGQYLRVVRLYQMSASVGSLVIGLLPGILADAYGSYRPFYVLMVFMAAVCALITLVCIAKSTSCGHECGKHTRRCA